MPRMTPQDWDRFYERRNKITQANPCTCGADKWWTDYNHRIGCFWYDVMFRSHLDSN